MIKSHKVILFFIFRFLLYASLMVLLNLIYFHDATHITGTGKFGENSWTEIMQEIILFLSGCIFLVISRYNIHLRPVSYLGAIFFFISCIRELNNLIPFWPYLEIPLVILAGVVIYFNFSDLESSVLGFLNNRAISWLAIGVLVTYVFSRLFGGTFLWKQLLGDIYNRWAKNAAEEGIELLGYTLMLIGSIELVLQVIREKNEPVTT